MSILVNIVLGITLLYNRESILTYPFKTKGKRPSQMFETPLLKYLEKNAGTHKVNNLPYPVYSGHINHLYTPGYTGGNHMASLGKFLNVPKSGYAPYNWFDWLEDGDDLDYFDIGYHIGKRPLHPKWKPTPFNNLWRNSNVSDDITPSQSN